MMGNTFGRRMAAMAGLLITACGEDSVAPDYVGSYPDPDSQRLGRRGQPPTRFPVAGHVGSVPGAPGQGDLERLPRAARRS